MATLSQSIRLNDGMTPILKNIQRALQQTLNVFERMQDVSAQPIMAEEMIRARREINEVGAAIRQAEEQQQRLNQQMRQSGRSLDTANSNLDRMNRSINRATGSTDGLLSKFKQLAAASVITLTVKLSFDTFANFEQEMARVRAISGADAGQYKLLEDTARQLGRDTTFSATEAAEGMKYLAMAGWQTNQIVAAMPGMLNLAAAGAIDLGETADIVSDTMTGFGLSAEKAMHVADVFAETVTSTNTDVHMMGETMKYVAPVAKQFGASMEQTAALTGLMAGAGIKASQAGTSLRAGLLRLADPRARAEMQLDKLGLSFIDAAGNMKDIQVIIHETAAAFEKLSESERLTAAQRIFGVEAATGWLAVLDQGSEALDKMVTQLQNSDGASQAMADIMNNTILGNLKLMASYAEDAMIEVGMSMRDAFVDTTISAGRAVKQMSEEMKRLASMTEQYGVSMAQATALTDLMANAGIRGSSAEAALRTGLARLADAETQASAQLEKLGLSFVDAAGNMKDVQVIIHETAAAFEKLSERERLMAAQEIFGVEAASGWLAILKQGPEALDQMVAQMQSSDDLKSLGGMIIDGFKMGVDFIKDLALTLVPVIVRIGAAFAQLKPVVAMVFALIGKGVEIFAGSLNVIGAVVNTLLGFWPVVPIIGALVAGLLGYKAAVMGIAVAKGIATAATAVWTAAVGAASTAQAIWTTTTHTATAAQWRLNMALVANPLGLIISLVAAVIGGVIAFGAVNDATSKKLLSAWYGWLDGWDQIKLGILTVFISIDNAMTNMVLSAFEIIEGFINGAISLLNKGIAAINATIHTDFGGIKPIDITSERRLITENYLNSNAEKLQNAQLEAQRKAQERQEKLAQFGQNNGLSGADYLNNALAQMEAPIAAVDSLSSLDNVGRVDSIGSIENDVNISDENLKLMEELVTRKYVNQINLQTAAPQVTVAPTVQITKEADADQLVDYVNNALTEQAISSAEQSYIKER